MYVIFIFAKKNTKYMCYFSGEIIFFGGSLVIYTLFIHLAKEWPKIMAKWELMEREIKQFGQPPKTALKFKILICIIMSLSTSM